MTSQPSRRVTLPGAQVTLSVVRFARIGALIQARASWDVLLREKAVLVQEKFDLQVRFNEEKAKLQTQLDQQHFQIHQMQTSYDDLRAHLQQVENGKMMRAMNAAQQGLNKILGRNQ